MRESSASLDTGLDNIGSQLFPDPVQFSDGYGPEEDEEGYVMVQERSHQPEHVHQTGVSVPRKRYQRMYSLTDGILIHPSIHLSSDDEESGRLRSQSSPLKKLLPFEEMDRSPTTPILTRATQSLHHSRTRSIKEAISKPKTPPPTPPKPVHHSKNPGSQF